MGLTPNDYCIILGVVVIILYISGGAVIFKWLEEESDVQSRHYLAQSVHNFMERNGVSGKFNGIIGRVYDKWQSEHVPC